MQLPTVDAWNLTVQHQLTKTISAEIAYVGNKGTHGFAGTGPAYNLNQATVQGFGTVPFNLRRNLYLRYPFQSADPVTGTCTALDLTKPASDPTQKLCWTQNIDYFGNDASNNYHGFQAKVEKRMAHGLQFLAHYTWSQAFNYDADYYPIDPRVNHGPNDLNRRHVFVLSQVWDLPFGRGKDFYTDASTWANALIGGWTITSVTNWSGGLPFSPTYDECGADRDTGPCRPNQVGSFDMGRSELVTPAPGQGSPYVQYFDPVAHFTTNGQTNGAFQRPEKGSFGTAGRNSLRGPRFFNTDLSVFKRIWTAERWNAQFRFNAFNVFNHRNNGTPGVFFSAFGGGGGNCINCSDFASGQNGGRITSLGGPMRQLEFGLRVEF
jgi:hypothetical protein